MRKDIFFIVLLFSFVVLLQGSWQNIRQSALTIDNEVVIRYESDVPDIENHQMSYYTAQQWLQSDVISIGGDTFQSSSPFDNLTERSLSFRIEDSGSINVIPGFTTQQPVSLDEMTTLSSYPRDTSIPNHLNIAGEKMLLSDDRIYFALNNFGGGFPVSASFFTVFFSYTMTIFPETDGIPDYVYSLIYTVDLGDIISPGLFKIDSDDQGLTQIGSVTTQINTTTNTLYISCLISDLMADADFAAAFSPDEPLNVVAMTQRITNFGQNVELMDEGNYHNVYLQKQTLIPAINTLPELSNIEFSIVDGVTTISLDYYDAEANFPLTHQLETDTGSVFIFDAADNDFTQTVSFQASFSEEWSSATIRFSDNDIDFVEYEIFNVKPQSPQNIVIEVVENDVLLSWDEVTEDTQGNPVTVSHYTIYYSTSHPGENEFIQLANIEQPSFIHQEAAGSVERSFYRITAIIDR